MRIPDVRLFSEWKAWATALTKELTTPQRTTPLVLPQYTTAQLADVPPNRDGLLIWHLDTAKVAYSYNGHWYQLYNNGLIV